MEEDQACAMDQRRTGRSQIQMLVPLSLKVPVKVAGGLSDV